MNIAVSTQGFGLTQAINDFACSQLESALRTYSDMVVSVDVFMKDINGPKGGEDKQVLVRTRLRSGQVIAVECTRANLYSAIAATTRRSKRSVRRALRKLRRIERLRLRELRYGGHLHVRSSGGYPI